MPRLVCLPAAALAALLAIAPGSSSAQPAQKPIVMGTVRQFHSAILGEDRTLQVSLPETYERTTIAYPVLFLLDGSSHLLHATATTRFLASARFASPK